MVTSFMIGNDLLFDTSEMVLHHLKDGESIHLSGVKGRCLKCLISHTQQDITTKKQICDEVWGQFGLFASDSTLLQTIYALRRDLRDIEMTDLIVTHPRLGYQINPAYSVTPVAELGAEKNEPAASEVFSCPSDTDILSAHYEIQKKTEGKKTDVAVNLSLHKARVILAFLTFVLTTVLVLLTVFFYREELRLHNGGKNLYLNPETGKDGHGQKGFILCQCNKYDTSENCKNHEYICKKVTS